MFPMFFIHRNEFKSHFSTRNVRLLSGFTQPEVKGGEKVGKISLSRNPDLIPKNIHRPCVQPCDRSVYLSLLDDVLQQSCDPDGAEDGTVASPWSPTCSTFMSNSPWTFLPLNTFALQVKTKTRIQLCFKTIKTNSSVDVLKRGASGPGWYFYHGAHSPYFGHRGHRRICILNNDCEKQECTSRAAGATDVSASLPFTIIWGLV